MGYVRELLLLLLLLLLSFCSFQKALISGFARSNKILLYSYEEDKFKKTNKFN